MKKPNIIYCNVIREDKEADRIAIKATHIEEMIDALIEAKKAIETTADDEFGIGVLTDYNGNEQVYFLKHELLQNIEQALKKAGVE